MANSALPEDNKLFYSFKTLAIQNKDFALIAIDIANYHTLKMLLERQKLYDPLQYIISNLQKFLTSSCYIYNNRIIILIEDLHESPLNIHQLVNELYQILTNPTNIYHLNNISPIITFFSASYPKDLTNLESFFQKMEVIFEKAKFCRDKNDFTYEEGEKLILEEINKNIQIDKLKTYIKNKKLSLAFQDIIERKGGRISHYECLLRLNQDDGKFLTAGPYISLAEEYEFITSIDEMVLEFVAEEAKNNIDICFSFNLSGPGVYNTNWLKRARYLFKKHDIAERIIVEITETSVKKDLGKAALFVVSLQELGCKIALDDFGSGYTSFRQLKALPVDFVKIDGAFIKDIVNNTDNYLFVKLLLEMSHGIGCKVIAEYVETAETAKVLIDLGVDYMQGNFFSPAVNYKPWEGRKLT